MNWTTSAKKRIKKRKLSSHDGTSPSLLHSRGLRQLHDIVMTNSFTTPPLANELTSSQSMGGQTKVSVDKNTASSWNQPQADESRRVSTDVLALQKAIGLSTCFVRNNESFHRVSDKPTRQGSNIVSKTGAQAASEAWTNNIRLGVAQDKQEYKQEDDDEDVSIGIDDLNFALPEDHDTKATAADNALNPGSHPIHRDIDPSYIRSSVTENQQWLADLKEQLQRLEEAQLGSVIRSLVRNLPFSLPKTDLQQICDQPSAATLFALSSKHRQLLDFDQVLLALYRVKFSSQVTRSTSLDDAIVILDRRNYDDRSWQQQRQVVAKKSTANSNHNEAMSSNAQVLAGQSDGSDSEHLSPFISFERDMGDDSQIQVQVAVGNMDLFGGELRLEQEQFHRMANDHTWTQATRSRPISHRPND